MLKDKIRLIVTISAFCAVLPSWAQNNKPNVIDGKDYNESFYLKFHIGSGLADWRLHFPENVIDTSQRLLLPEQNRLKFKTTGAETHFGFSALFGLRWGKFGGGFASSIMAYDSLRTEVNEQELRFSYNKERISFNRFFLTYESNPWSLDTEDEFLLSIDASVGTFILFPVAGDIVPKSNLFVMLGPQIDYKLERSIFLFLSTAYEFRYFKTTELFGSRELVYNNYINSFNIKLGVKLRISKDAGLLKIENDGPNNRNRLIEERVQ